MRTMFRPQAAIFILFVGILIVGAFFVVTTFMRTEPTANQPRSPGDNAPRHSGAP